MPNKIRDFYLQHIWSRYPTPCPGGVCGRLVHKSVTTQSLEAAESDVGSFQETTLFFEFTNDEGKKINHKLDLNNLVWFDNKVSALPVDVLKFGDWIQLWYENISVDKVNVTAENKLINVESASANSNANSEGAEVKDEEFERAEVFEVEDEEVARKNSILNKVLLLAPCLNSEVLEVSNQEMYRNWIQFLNQVRQFFIKKKFDEIKTPTLVVCPGTEPFLEPFATEFKFGQSTQEYFLPTSPELSLKKCLARGWNKIFEIRPCFRNGEMSAWHSSEFYMLEWYRSFENLESIKSDICLLLEELEFPGWKKSKLVNLSMADLFKKYLQFELNPNTTANELLSLAAELNLKAGVDWDFDDIFYLLYVEKIEPRLGEFEFLVLEKYPPSQAALARLTSEGWGERFEFYINGVEIANAFHELNDPQIQRLRFEEDLEKKKKYGKRNIPLDENFLLHLEQGMPPAAGIALGLERLFMIYAKIKDIQQITPY